MRLLHHRAVCLLVVLGLGLAHAAPPFDGSAPELIRLTGYPGPPKADGRTPQSLVVDDGGTQRAFQLLALEVVTGRRSAASVRDALEPLKPSLFLSGPKSVLAPYREAPDGQMLVIEGWLADGRRFMASTIRAAPAP
ncbi:MAG: hypothetical protein KIT14_22075 [bacterium]|nr:hypothetical protein [bacterium]